MPDRLDKFTEGARRVLGYALEESQRLQQNYVGTEHVLLGILRDETSLAGQVLADLGISLAEARPAVAAIVRGQAVAPSAPPAGGLTARAKRVIELAVDEARRLGHHHVGTEHLLLGLIRESEGVGAAALESLGAHLETVREHVQHVLDEPPVSPREALLWQPVAAQAPNPVSRESADTSTGPALRELRRVIPVAQSQRVGDLAVTVLSLESYDDGFIVNLRILSDSEPSAQQFVRPTLNVGDDAGLRYQVWPGGGYGQGAQWRLSFHCVPALPDSETAPAPNLRLELPEIRWFESREVSRAPREESRLGPWSFTIALPRREVSTT